MRLFLFKNVFLNFKKNFGFFFNLKKKGNFLNAAEDISEFGERVDSHVRM